VTSARSAFVGERNGDRRRPVGEAPGALEVDSLDPLQGVPAEPAELVVAESRAERVVTSSRARVTAKLAMPPGPVALSRVHTSVPGTGPCSNPVKTTSKNNKPDTKTSTTLISPLWLRTSERL